VQKKDNPANFGFGCSRQCICEVLGQVPCPGVVPLPKHMRGKYRHPVD
jgi:small subunit ribosomal protein S25